MERIKRYLKFIQNGSAKKLFLTVLRTIEYNSYLKIQKHKDAHKTSYQFYKESRLGFNPVCIDSWKLDCSGISLEKAEKLWTMYQQHRFDLLGSGWVKSNFKDKSQGLDGCLYEELFLNAKVDGIFLENIVTPQNVEQAKKIYTLIQGEYEPIDWQKDFKTGYRWSATQWYRPQEIAKKLGGDIKVPWELSRLQHLPRLAILYLVLEKNREDIYVEFQNQLLDFIAQNPVRWGVNHMCTMDVGIRVANIALAVSLWNGLGIEFDKEFETVVTNYLFEECEFIRRNLEWSYYLTSNHYFANIAGLIWGSAVLPECKRRDKWLKFARMQLGNEIRKQFNADGSNGEGSTAYHRLTSEMAVYSCVLVHYLSVKNDVRELDEDIYNLIATTGCFTNDITRPDGMFTQIGDNDSGLFFKLSITGDVNENQILEENMNDGGTFVSAVSGMCLNENLKKTAEKYPLEASMVKSIAKDDSLAQEVIVSKAAPQQKRDKLDYSKEYYIDSQGNDLLKGIKRIDYPKFGIYIFKSEELYLCVNATDNGQKGNAGHAHNDKLSFELFIHGECIFEDPGTYVYTPFPELRDQFRSTKYHNTIYCGEEQNRYNGLFSMYDDTRCNVVGVGNNWIEVQVEYRGIIHRRKIEIEQKGLRIVDMCNREFQQQFVQQPVARGYGKMER